MHSIMKPLELLSRIDFAWLTLELLLLGRTIDFSSEFLQKVEVVDLVNSVKKLVEIVVLGSPRFGSLPIPPCLGKWRPGYPCKRCLHGASCMAITLSRDSQFMEHVRKVVEAMLNKEITILEGLSIIFNLVVEHIWKMVKH